MRLAFDCICSGDGCASAVRGTFRKIKRNSFIRNICLKIQALKLTHKTISDIKRLALLRMDNILTDKLQKKPCIFFRYRALGI